MNYSALADRELLGKLMGVRAATKLYNGSLKPLFCEDGRPHEKCAVARELVKRWLAEEIRRDCLLSTPAAVRDWLRLQLADLPHEVFGVLWLDNQNRLIEYDELFRGTLSQTSVFPREVIKQALVRNAAAAILVHNHPSGVAEPSRADEMLTRGLKDALAMVDVKIADHFIVAGAAVLSFAERGLL